MLSTILQAEPLLGNPFTAFHGGFSPWEHVEPQFFPQLPNPSSNHVNNETNPNPNPICFAGLDSGSDGQDQNKTSPNQTVPNQTYSKSSSVLSGSGSDEPNKSPTGFKPGSCSGSDEQSRLASLMDERKRKRMLSNRESARRSRWRKQTHLEDLRNMVNNLKIENRQLMNQLRFITHHILLTRRDNNRLRTEKVILQRRLMELVRILQLQRLHRNLSSSSIPMHGHANI